MTTLTGRSNNRAVASEIAGLLAEMPHGFEDKVEKILDQAYTSRRSRAPKNGIAFARRDDKNTSQAASLTVNVTRLERTVLNELATTTNPVTMFDLEVMTGMSLVTVSPRMKPLVQKGLVAEIGVSKTSGRPRTLYQITTAGREFLTGAIAA